MSVRVETIEQMYREQQTIEDNAWQMFKQAFERETPPPILEPMPEHRQSWIYYVMLFGLVGALVVSGMQTVPAFYMVLREAGLHPILAGIGGVAAFVAVDIVMFSASHYLVETRWRLRGKANEENFKKIERFIEVAQWFGFAVSIGSNFYFVFFAFHVNEMIMGVDTGLTLVVASLIALAPGIQGLAVGSVIAALPITQEIERIRVQRRNHALMDDYQRSMKASWARRKASYGVTDMEERIARLEDKQVFNPVHEFHEVHETRENTGKRSPKRQMVHEYLNENPDAIHMPIVEFANLLNISTGLASEERNAWYQSR